MFTKNDPMRRRFVNGTIGMVEGFSKESGEPIVKTNTGRAILAEPMEWGLMDGGRALARLTQVPLRLAWAITVHKSQGMSLEGAHMDLSDTFEYGQGYVALSRVRTLEGLSLAGLNDRALEVHPDVSAKDAEFQRESEEAGKRFSGIALSELAAMHENFIRSCGGKVLAETSAEKSYSVDVVRQTHRNAYKPWSEEEDTSLAARYHSGVTITALAKEFGRGRGAIVSRLAKLA